MDVGLWEANPGNGRKRPTIPGNLPPSSIRADGQACEFLITSSWRQWGSCKSHFFCRYLGKSLKKNCRKSMICHVLVFGGKTPPPPPGCFSTVEDQTDPELNRKFRMSNQLWHRRNQEAIPNKNLAVFSFTRRNFLGKKL